MHTPSSVSDLVERAVLLDNGAFKQFLATVYHERALQRAHLLPREEADLLKKINAGFPKARMERFMVLDEKRRQETLSSEEHRELLRLVRQLEKFDVQRVQWLGELAILRKVPLREVMKQLGIPTRADG
jgi:hypothetical protein